MVTDNTTMTTCDEFTKYNAIQIHVVPTYVRETSITMYGTKESAVLRAALKKLSRGRDETASFVPPLEIQQVSHTMQQVIVRVPASMSQCSIVPIDLAQV